MVNMLPSGVTVMGWPGGWPLAENDSTTSLARGSGCAGEPGCPVFCGGCWPCNVIAGGES
jgi:hypothetical protein